MADTAELLTLAQLKMAFYRLLGTDTLDELLTEQGESADDVSYLCITEGVRAAQRYLIDQGYKGWRKRSSALSWSGTDTADGGRYSDLPADFLRAFGDRRFSCIQEASGNSWGAEIEPEKAFQKGDFYYFLGEEIWLARNASPPTTAYLVYHYLHPKLDDATGTIDFPVEMRPLIVAEAGNFGKNENWIPGEEFIKGAIREAVTLRRAQARNFIRRSKKPRQFKKPLRLGNHW